MFHLAMARLATVSGKSADCDAHLKAVSYVFNSTNTCSQNAPIQDEDSSVPNEITYRSMSPRFKMDLAASPFVGSKSESVENAPASPEFKCTPLKAPELLNHEPVEGSGACSCEQCSQLDCQHSALVWSLCREEAAIVKNVPANHCRERLGSIISTAVKYTAERDKIAKAFMSSMGKAFQGASSTGAYQDVVVETTKVLVHACAVQKDLDGHASWSERLQKVLSLEIYPWVVTSYVSMAESRYLGQIPALPWAQISKKSETSLSKKRRPVPTTLDDLCSKVSNLNLDHSKICPTPMIQCVVAKKGLSRAPVRKKRGRGAVQTINFEEEEFSEALEDKEKNLEEDIVNTRKSSQEALNKLKEKQLQENFPTNFGSVRKSRGRGSRKDILEQIQNLDDSLEQLQIVHEEPETLNPQGTPKAAGYSSSSVGLLRKYLGPSPPTNDTSIFDFSSSSPMLEKATTKKGGRTKAKSATSSRSARGGRKPSKDVAAQQKQQQHSSLEKKIEQLREAAEDESPKLTADWVMPVLEENDENDLERSVAKVLTELEEAFELLCKHPAAVPYRQVCQALALCHLSLPQTDINQVAYYLTEAQSVVFRHNLLMDVSRKLRKLAKDTSSPLKFPGLNTKLTTLKRFVSFDKTPKHIKQLTDDLPQGWTICQLNVLASPTHRTGELFITRFSKGCPPLVQHLPGFGHLAGQKVLESFSDILTASQITMQISDRSDWWRKREHLNKRLQKDVLSAMDVFWLGCWRGMLLGSPQDTAVEQALELAAESFIIKCEKLKGVELPQQAITSLQAYVRILLDSAIHLSDRELVECVHLVTGLHDAAVINKLIHLVRTHSSNLLNKNCKRNVVILILDSTVQHLPWENLQYCRPHPYTRLPSLYFLQALLHVQRSDHTSLYNQGMDPSRAYYILNPEDNLPSTQQQFQDWFKKEPGWSGLVAVPPTQDQYKTALSSNDLFIYCGHGGGNRFISSDSLQGLPCRAVALLMGCSSGRLKVRGQLEAYGLVLNYLLAGSPCIIANLWDVTDKDIDRFTEKLLKEWLEARSGDLVTCMAACRDTCRMPYLIGAAPVVYGLPIKLQKS